MPHPALAAALAGASLLGAAAAHANRPLNADTADTVTNGRCQFEPYAGSSRSDGVPTARLWLLQVNCGVTARTQLGASLARTWSDDESAHIAAASGKTNLVELKSGQTGFALGYGVSASRPRGGTWSGEGLFLNGIASRELSDGWLVHANLGFTRSRSADQSSTTYALATELTVRPEVVLSAELYGDDRTRPWAAVGALWQFNERFSANLSYGVQNARPRVRQWTAGFLVEF